MQQLNSRCNFSEEVFKIQRVSRRQNLYTYILEDLNGEIIDGFFYTEELVLASRTYARSRSEQTSTRQVGRILG